METNKRGRGRPPKPAAEQLAEIFAVRVTADERAELEKASGGKLSTWAREVLLRAAKRRNR